MADVNKYAEIVTNHEHAQEELNQMIAEIDDWILEETGSTLCYYLQELGAKLEKLRLVEDKVVDDLTRYFAKEKA
jgi:primosomal protein N''